MKQTDQRELLAKHMSRKEFLQLAGVMVLSAIGITNFMMNIRSQLSGAHANGQRAGRGFGASKFGV